MQLSVAANWDMALLEGLAAIPEVTSIYAKVPFDVVGGGRAGVVVPSVDWDFAAAYIDAAHRHDLSFCYLVNAPCLGNLEQFEEGKKSILSFIGLLADIGVDSVSIANLSVAALVRHNFPNLPIRGSVLSWPTSLSRLKYQESLGIDPLIIPYSEFNRDFKLLKKIRNGLSCSMQLFANVACIYNCHYLAEHACSVGHASQLAGDNQRPQAFFDYYLWQCTRRRLLNPEQLLMSRWIRPEDISAYEALGFGEFKIIDRSRSTDWLLRATRAYAARSYHGNLLDIISLELLGDSQGFHNDIEVRIQDQMRLYTADERQLMRRMLKLRRRLLNLELSIDNDSLTGFLNGFRTIRCAETYCETCGYCRHAAEQTIHLDREEAECLAKDIGSLLTDFLQLLTSRG